MTTQQLKESLVQKRLNLDRKSFLKHYEAPIWCGILCIVMFGYFFYLQIRDPFRLTAPMLMLLVFPGMTLAVWLNQYRILRFGQIDTNLDDDTSYRIAKYTLETLQWPIYKEKQNVFLQANNPFNDIRTWGDEMITIVIDKKRVLVNSICNPDYGKMAQAGLSFGKNKQNVKKFIQTFDLLSMYPEKAGVYPERENDKIVIVKKINYTDLKKVLAAFCEMYPESKYKTEIRVTKLPSNSFAILFPCDIEFELFCYLVNYIRYPVELEWDAEIAAWATTRQGDKWITDKSANKQVMLFIPDDDQEHDTIFMTTVDGIGYKIRLQIHRGKELLKTPKKQFESPPFEVSDLKDYESEDITE